MSLVTSYSPATLVSSNLFDLFQSELSRVGSPFLSILFLGAEDPLIFRARGPRGGVVKIADVKGHCYLSFIRRGDV